MTYQELIDLGITAREQTEPEKCLAYSGQAFIVDPDGAAAFNNYGNTLREMGQPKRAIPFLQHAVILDPEMSTAKFNLAVATTGWNAKRLSAANRNFKEIHSHPNSHATYYPGASQFAMKLIFDPSNGEILGAQGVGKEGVDKRIDVIATAIHGGITAPELADLELAYAPPFGSAKDPVNMLGYIAENLISGLTEIAQWNELDK